MLVLLTAVAGCVEPYDPKLSLSTDLVVVSGTITDQAQTQTITLSHQRSTNDSVSTSTPIQQASVEVIINGTILVTLRETAPGTYQLPTGFRGQAGNSYQLQFKTAEGTSYQSTIETMPARVAISRAYDEFNPTGTGQKVANQPVPTNDVYIDFQDPPGAHNFYSWRWRVYERQDWCATCQQGRYIIKNVGDITQGKVEGSCVPDRTLGTYNFYDYTCRELCWEIFYSRNLNIFADIYTNGNPVKGRLVAQVPIYQLETALLVIEQLSLTTGAYRYYNLLVSQAQNSGTLADSPPAPTAGNVHNLADDTENVVGYFSASSVTELRYRLNRPVTPGTYLGLFYFQNGRLPKLEPVVGEPQYGVGLPSAICVPSGSRTNLKRV